MLQRNEGLNQYRSLNVWVNDKVVFSDFKTSSYNILELHSLTISSDCSSGFKFVTMQMY